MTAEAASASASRTSRHWSHYVIMAVALTMSLYHLYVAFFGAPDAQVFRAVHILFALLLAFLIYPTSPSGRLERPGILSVVLIALSIAACAYQYFAKEVIDNFRDRRTLASALIMGPLFGPMLFAFVINLSIER